MSRGNRGIILALVGWLILGASQPPERAAGEKQTNEQAEIYNSLQEISATLKRANEPDETTTPCAPDKPNRNSDLCAQWQAADASAEAARAGWMQVWLGLAGVLVGLLTLIAAGAAAIYARSAVVETKNSNEIARRDAERAQREAELARQALLQSERAIISVESIAMLSAPLAVKNRWRMAIDVRNSGKSNASNFFIVYRVMNEPVFRTGQSKTHSCRGICTSQGLLTFDSLILRTPAKLPAFLIGYIVYDTLHAGNFKTFFCYRINELPSENDYGEWENSYLERFPCQMPPDS